MISNITKLERILMFELYKSQPTNDSNKIKVPVLHDKDY